MRTRPRTRCRRSGCRRCGGRRATRARSANEARTKAWNEGLLAGRSDPFEPHWVTLGTATILAGETTTLELRLPPEWENER